MTNSYFFGYKAEFAYRYHKAD